MYYCNISSVVYRFQFKINGNLKLSFSIFSRFLAGEGGLPHLEHLDLSGCMQVTAAGLTELVSACGSLDHAHLFYCDNMVVDPYAVTASGCQNLEISSRKCCRSGF